MKGCPLSCWWCHNPESRLASCEPYIESHKLDDKEFRKEEVIGREIDTQELMYEIEKDLVFMKESGGGVTFSGGEPLFQPDFLEEVLAECKSHNIDTAIDTSGFAPTAVIQRIIPLTDIFLYDLKLMNDKRHIDFTGQSIALILQNLELIASAGKRIWIRLPLIEDINDQPENIHAIAGFLKSLPGNVEMINILPYHTIGKSKYAKFGKENRMAEMRNYPVEKSGMILNFFRDNGFKSKIGG
jgi:pyruvate formate lyase activating enzyme